jgi:hypothetical protein
VSHSGFALSLAFLDLVNVAVELVEIGSPVMAQQFIERRFEDLADTLELARTHRRLDGCDARIG